MKKGTSYTPVLIKGIRGGGRGNKGRGRGEGGGGEGGNTYLGGVLGDIYGLGGGYLFGEKHFLEWGAYSRKYGIGEKRRHGT